MPGTPGRPRRSPARGVSDTLDQENVAPPAIDSPGGLMSKRKDRVSRRYSVLKVLGRTESAVSPGGEMPSSSAAMADAGPAAAAKKRRNSRVSFGHIQTAVFQKDSDRTDSPSSGNPPGVQFQQINTNNLSALPDDTVVPSPAASDSGSMDMDITRRDSLASVALSSLPPISDMAAGDASFASFASDDANNSRRESLAEQAAPAPKPAMSLADLIADDEGDERVNPLEFSANSARSMLRAPGDRTSSASDMQRADLTDHDLTADIKGPGDNTRKLGDHTGAFMAGEQTVALQQQQQRARDRESGAMELTTAYGGILSHAMAEESECADETVEMELTSAVGGIVEAKRRQSLTAAAKQRQSLAGVLSKVRGAMGEASEAAGTAPEAGVAMEMRGSFGRILSSAIGTGGAELDQTMEDEDTAEATGGAKTYHDDEVTMFTPLSRITKGKANAHKRTSLAADLVMDDSLPLQTRSRSTTPTGRRSSAAASEEKAEQYGNRRRSMRASLAAGMLEEDKIDTLDKFLEEIGIRFLTNVKHNKRKSSVGGMLTRASTDGAEATLHDKLLLVLTTGTETGQTEKNTKKLRDMLTILSDAMSELEDAVNEKNPAVFAEVSLDADTEQALAVQKRMKTLKKLCRARAEIRWVAWRQEAALKMEEALLKNTDALMDDMRALDAALEKATAASLAAKQGRRAEAVTELAATLDRLADSESEQGLVLEGLRSQVEAWSGKKESLVETVDDLKQRAAAATPAEAADDSMILAEDHVASSDVERALHIHEALKAVSPWAIVRTSAEEWVVDMPRARRLCVAISPAGAVTNVFFQDMSSEVRDSFETQLWTDSGVEHMLAGIKTLKALLAALPEISFRVCRVHGLVRELDRLARSFSLRRSVSPAGAPVVTAAAVNAAGNYKVAVKVELPWHYPAGRLKYESEWMVGQADEEMVADVMARHSCGQLRLTRILNDLSGSK